MNSSKNLGGTKNAQILMNIIFSKEFSKILKIGLDYCDPKITDKSLIERLICCNEEFFKLLAIHASDKVLTLQTDKLIRNKMKDLKKKKKKEELAKKKKIDLAKKSVASKTGNGLKQENGEGEADPDGEEGQNN